VLDFVKDLNDPRLRPTIKPDFMKMNIKGLERVFDTELPISGFDLTPGFKPNLDFIRKRVAERGRAKGSKRGR